MHIGGKARRKETTGRPKQRSMDNIKIGFGRERMGWYGMGSGSGPGPVEGSCEPGTELSGSTKYWEIL
jgi:hypothetical protein